jgi:hypothetical protein
MVKVPAGINAVIILSGPVPPVPFTVSVSVQLCPPKLNAKLAVPLAVGVPVMVYVILPAPEANVPAVRVAVRPVTPVEAILCALYAPPLPPV